MKLIKLHLVNFKGIADFRLHLDGQSAVVTGDNGAGKTTLLDAYLWTLHGHDSAGNRNPDVRPVNGGDKTVVMVKVEDITGRAVSYSRDVQDGSNGYYINAKQVKASDYWQAIAGTYIKPYLSTPWAFASLHWKERRAVLEDVAGMESLGRLESLHAKYSKKLKGCKAEVERSKVIVYVLEKLAADGHQVSGLLYEWRERVKVDLEMIESYEKKLYQIEGGINTLGGKLRKLVDLPGFDFEVMKQNKDGDSKPTCNTVYQGTRWDKLNHAKQIEAGLALINRLFEHHKISQPVFIDNAEAIVNPAAPEGMQAIWLKAAPGGLNVEHEETE